MLGLILAGGQSRRFGADKALAKLAGMPLIGHVAIMLRRSVTALAVAGSAEAALAADAVLLADPDGSPKGPLSGVLAGLDWAKENSWLVTAPCDAPFLPHDLAARLIAGAVQAKADLAIARTQDGLQPLCAAWRPTLRNQLAAAMAGGRHPAVHDFAAAMAAAEIFFSEGDRFLNVNTQGDLRRAERILSGPS